MEEIKTPYDLSKDYELLFKLICEGYRIPCWIDYDWSHDGDIARDICYCRRFEEWHISLSARGIGYFSIYPFLQENCTHTEKEMFVQLCTM